MLEQWSCLVEQRLELVDTCSGRREPLGVLDERCGEPEARTDLSKGRRRTLEACGRSAGVPRSARNPRFEPRDLPAQEPRRRARRQLPDLREQRFNARAVAERERRFERDRKRLLGEDVPTPREGKCRLRRLERLRRPPFGEQGVRAREIEARARL